MRLLIGIPSHDYIHAEFVKCLVALTTQLTRDGINFETFINNGTLVYVARDKIARKAINEEFTHVLWLDSDMVFTQNLYSDLMDCGKDFVTGIAHARRKPFASCLFTAINDDGSFTRYEGDYPNEPFEVAGCGFACVLISTEILRNVQFRYKTCFLPFPEWGEDLSFCRRAKSLGYKIWVEPMVQLGHIGHEVIYPEDHAKYLESLSQ